MMLQQILKQMQQRQRGNSRSCLVLSRVLLKLPADSEVTRRTSLRVINMVIAIEVLRFLKDM